MCPGTGSFDPPPRTNPVSPAVVILSDSIIFPGISVTKSKWLVIADIVLFMISLKFGAYFASIYIQTGEFDITGIDPDQNTPLIISAIVFLAVVGVLVKDFI